MNIRDCTTYDDLNHFSLLQIHSELARLERRVEEELTARSDAAEALRAWETVNDPHQVYEFYKIQRWLRERYYLIASVSQEKERAEIAALRAEFRQSVDPAISKLITEAIAIERALQ